MIHKLVKKLGEQSHLQLLVKTEQNKTNQLTNQLKKPNLAINQTKKSKYLVSVLIVYNEKVKTLIEN